MKKFVIIIIILSIILAGMMVARKAKIQKDTINVQEIEEIEAYINQIYMWEEVTGEALPNFEIINQAPEKWIWETIKKNLEEDKPTKQQIEEKGKELFGQNFDKELPKEGNESFKWNQETNQYEPIEPQMAEQGDLFLLDNIKRIKKGYEVDIIEYIEDYSPMLQEEPEDYTIIRNNNKEEIGKINANEEGKATELVKENKERFSKKKLQLKKENDKLYVERVYK